MMSTKVKVLTFPPCDICKYEEGSTTPEEAHYDGATIRGPWAYMCDRHFETYGLGLGTGVGQRLVLESEWVEES